MANPTPKIIAHCTIGNNYHLQLDDGGGLLDGEHHFEEKNAKYLGLNKDGYPTFKINNICRKSNTKKCSKKKCFNASKKKCANASKKKDSLYRGYPGICACMTLFINSREGWNITSIE